MKKPSHPCLVVLFSLVICIVIPASAQYDMVLLNGKIVDGTGNSWYYGDIAVKDGKIAKIGKSNNWKSDNVIEAAGFIVAPGFIDVHTHIEGNDLKVPTANNFIMDGVTTVITGNCGGSNVHVEKYFGQLDSAKTSINVATLIGHNSVRKEVMGEENRDPTPEEQEKMEALVEQSMREGAVGFSTGLIYVPGTYSKTDEVIGLAKAAAKYRGVYVSHIRNEAEKVKDAIDEAVNIGRMAGMPVQISHFKVTYKPNFGKSAMTLEMVEKARAEGIDVTIDQYPYIASATTLNTQLPTWAFSGGTDSLKIRLQNTAMRARIKNEMLALLKKDMNLNYSFAVVANYKADTSLNGKTITEVNKLKKRKPLAADEAETILEMVEQESVAMVYFSMDEGDLRRIMKYPFSMVASDAGIAKFGSGVPHPRAYGTNARVLGEYVRKLKLIPMEEAIRRMTSLPAQKFQLHDRGLLKEGMAADIVVLDPASVGDVATFKQPHQYSNGFIYVIVNGQIAAQGGQHMGTRSGKVLRGPGWSKGN